MLSHPSAVWVPELFVCICWSSKPNSGGFNHRAVWAACFAHFLATPSNQIDRVHWVHAMPIALTLHFTVHIVVLCITSDLAQGRDAKTQKIAMTRIGGWI